MQNEAPEDNLGVSENELSEDSTEASSETSPEVIRKLKRMHGINKCVKIVIEPFHDEMVRKVKQDLLLCESPEETQYTNLKNAFLQIVSRLVSDRDVIEDSGNETNAEIILERMLRHLGEEPVESEEGVSDVECFRKNLKTFLKLSFKDEALELAFKDVESVDEAVTNLLSTQCEFK